ncbi:hypothetical protein [Zunongwangia profunda]|uniref:hypothetical protein n=1 Tax=Zunongwangia profunda TaxID=398743 RepID=UPI0030DB8B45|tara:strand:- start:2818 stop:3387 length:570 start_codon:yes stop_codon:yes gene_type:complete
MKTWKKIGLIISAILLILVVGSGFLLYQFLTSLQAPKIEITENYISTNRDFINGVTIEKITVDSTGGNGLPAKYTVNYWTNCIIDHPQGQPPEPPDKIVFHKKGKYWWIEDKADFQYVHKGLGRTTVDEKKRFPLSAGLERLPTCPMEFEREQWYFITIGDPQVTGIFFFIDKKGNNNQYLMPSGVSPI